MDWKNKITNLLKKDINKKTAFFINLKDNVNSEASAVFLGELLPQLSVPYLAIFFNLEIPYSFIPQKLSAKTSESYLFVEDHEAIDRYVFEGVTKSWYHYKNITDYRGIALGQIFEYGFQKYLTQRIKNLEVIRKVVEQENIQRIITLDDSGELDDVVQLYADSQNIPLLRILLRKSRPNVFRTRFKAAIANFFIMSLDFFVWERLRKKQQIKGIFLVDFKLARHFEHQKDEAELLRFPLEKGLGIRLKMLKEGAGYFPLGYNNNGHDSNVADNFQKRWAELSNDNEFKLFFNYRTIPLWGIVKGKLSVFFLKDVPRIISNIDILDEFAGRKRIKCSILRNDVKELERTIILALRLRQVPSLVVQHGILAETNGHNFLLADMLAAWGRATLDWYKKFGNDSQRLEITGNPCFDILTDWKPKMSKSRLCSKLGLDEDKCIVLFATQQINKFSSFWTDDLFWVIADKLLNVMRQFPDKQLVIKVDPYEETTPYDNIINRKKYNHAVAVRDVDIYSLIFSSDLVITQDSTVGLEAFLFDKPLITVNFTKRRDRVPYAEKGAAIGVYSDRDLPTAINQVLNDQGIGARLANARIKFLEEYAYKTDGQAGVRLANIFKYYARK